MFTAEMAGAQVRPAYTKNVDEPGRAPYEVWTEFSSFNCSFGCTNFTIFFDTILFDLPAVPAGKRLVIQNVSGRIPTRSGGHVALQSERVISLQKVKWGFFGPFFPFADVSVGLSGFSSQAFTTFGPGEVPHVNIYAPSHSSYDSSITFSGYLIDAAN
jgi:hypothetical protein